MDYLVTWTIDIEGALSPDDAARQAYDAFMRPGSIAHVFTARNKITGSEFEIDLDSRQEAARDSEPLTYPASREEGVRHA